MYTSTLDMADATGSNEVYLGYDLLEFRRYDEESNPIQSAAYGPDCITFPDGTELCSASGILSPTNFLTGSADFNGDTGVSIIHDRGPNHTIAITPTSDPGANFRYWVTKDSSSDTVYTNAGVTSSFDWIVYGLETWMPS